MRENVAALMQQMREELEVAEGTSAAILDKALQGRSVVKGYVERLKMDVLNNGFKDFAEEIHFFKHQLPEFYKYLIYYRRLYFIETHRGMEGGAMDEQLIEKERKRIHRDTVANRQFYIYYRSRSEFLDQRLFVRANDESRDGLILIPEDFADALDTSFLTHHSYLVARMLADDMVSAYLDRISGIASTSTDLPSVTWTDPKVALIEVALAIHARGAVNNGKAYMSDIIKVLERAFNVDLGNFNAVIQQNIRLRKKVRTAYLHELIEYVERRLDDQDEHPRYK